MAPGPGVSPFLIAETAAGASRKVRQEPDTSHLLEEIAFLRQQVSDLTRLTREQNASIMSLQNRLLPAPNDTFIEASTTIEPDQGQQPKRYRTGAAGSVNDANSKLFLAPKYETRGHASDWSYYAPRP